MDKTVVWLEDTPPRELNLHSTYHPQGNSADYLTTNFLSDAGQELPQMECQVLVERVNLDLSNSDSDSDGVEMKVWTQPSDSSLGTDMGHPGLLPLPPLHLSNTSSDYYLYQEVPVPLQVCREGSDDSLSLLGRPPCVVCQEKPCNTCLMHHHSRHTDICYSCALSYFTQALACPVCADRIVYIYMYDDI